MSSTPTATIRISEYVAFIASGSEISDPGKDSGYDRQLVGELARVGTRGGTIRVGAPALRDLAEFCEALSVAEGQAGNPSGARALTNLGEKALGLASGLEQR